MVPTPIPKTSTWVHSIGARQRQYSPVLGTAFPGSPNCARPSSVVNLGDRQPRGPEFGHRLWDKEPVGLNTDTAEFMAVGGGFVAVGVEL